MDQDSESRQRIKVWMGVAMIVVALTVDIVELVLEWLGIGMVTNVVTTPAFTFIFWLWFLMLGIPFMASPKRFFVFLAQCLAEIIPALDAVGGFFWTAGTIILVLMVRAEDKGGIIGEISGATMNLVQQRYRPYRKLGNKQFANKLSEIRETRRATGFNPLAISKNEIANKAAGRNPEFSKDQYGRAVEATATSANQSVAQKMGPQTRRQFLNSKRDRMNKTDQNNIGNNPKESPANSSSNTLNLKDTNPL